MGSEATSLNLMCYMRKNDTLRHIRHIIHCAVDTCTITLRNVYYALHELYKIVHALHALYQLACRYMHMYACYYSCVQYYKLVLTCVLGIMFDVNLARVSLQISKMHEHYNNEH